MLAIAMITNPPSLHFLILLRRWFKAVIPLYQRQGCMGGPNNVDATIVSGGCFLRLSRALTTGLASHKAIPDDCGTTFTYPCISAPYGSLKLSSGKCSNLRNRSR